MTTMTQELLAEMIYPEHSGGRTEVSIKAMRDIIAKHDPEGFNAFNPYEHMQQSLLDMSINCPSKYY